MSLQKWNACGSGSSNPAIGPCSADLLSRFGEFDERKQGVVDGCGYAELAAFAADESVERSDLGFLPGHHVLRRRTARCGHRLRDLVRTDHRRFRIFKQRKMYARCFGDKKNL